MKAMIQGWEVQERGPAYHTRREEPDGSISFEGVSDVTLRFTVIGNDAMEFLKDLRGMKMGTAIQEIQFGAPASELRKKLTGIENGRKYVFE